MRSVTPAHLCAVLCVLSTSAHALSLEQNPDNGPDPVFVTPLPNAAAGLAPEPSIDAVQTLGGSATLFFQEGRDLDLTLQSGEVDLLPALDQPAPSHADHVLGQDWNSGLSSLGGGSLFLDLK